MKHMTRPLASAILLLSLVAGSARADTFEPNNSTAQATGPMVSGVAVASFIGTVDDIDYFYFDANLGPVTITLTSIPSGVDYDLFIVDEGDNILLDSQNPGSTPEEIQANVTGAGRFFVVVAPFDGFSDVDSYLLTATFTPLVTNTPPTVNVTSPNGGETLTGGATIPVTWTASDAEDGTTLSVDIEYSANGGGSFTTVATGVANTGSFQWSVPNAATTQGRIRVTVKDSGQLTASDLSNANFTISTLPPVVIAVPSSLTAPPGTTLQVPVTLTNNVGMAALQFGVQYDAAVLLPIGATAGGRMAGMTMTANTGRSGEVLVLFHHPGGGTLAAGTGTAVTLAFQVSPSAPGNTTLTLFGGVAADAGENSLAVTYQQGAVTAVRYLEATVQWTSDGARIRWTADVDAGHVGFRVLRGEDEPNPAHEGLLPGDAREFTDRSPGALALAYWVEAVDRSGLVQRFGPFVAAGAPVLRVGLPHPNPMRGAVELPLSAGPVPPVVEVLDAAGRLLRRIDATGGTTGGVRWDGRTAAGDRAAAGIYFFRVRAGDVVTVRRVVKVAD